MTGLHETKHEKKTYLLFSCKWEGFLQQPHALLEGQRRLKEEENFISPTLGEFTREERDKKISANEWQCGTSKDKRVGDG